MHYTYFLFFLILWIFPIESQIRLKPINFHKPVPANGLSIFKPYKPLSVYHHNSQRQLPWVKKPRTQLQNKAPQRQQFVLYYPPLKPTHNPHANPFLNIKTKNYGIKNNNINNNYNTKNKNFNKIVPEEPEELQYEGNLSLENLEAGKKKVKIQNGEIGKNGFNDQIRNREQKKTLNYGNEYFYLPVPNSFVEPPGFATSDYRHYQKAEGNSVGVNKKNNKNDNYYKNHKMDAEEDDSVKNDYDRAPYVRDHAPENEIKDLEDSSELEEEDNKEEYQAPKKTSYPSEISPDGDRVDFQIHGHDGPKTYVFGFDTGDGKNRQYRLEERLKDGTVRGQYGYYDARGKLRAREYIARPIEGYEEKHHESMLPSSESSS